MITIQTTRGYDLPIQGAPPDRLETLPPPETVGVLPERIPFIKPKLAVAKGDAVAVGDLLFTDKYDPRIRFLSPGGGRIEAIHYGPRRVLREIVIRRKIDDEPVAALASPLTAADLANCERKELVAQLLAGGVWPLLRALPFRGIADPDAVPPAIYVGLDAREPFQVPAKHYLENRRAQFLLGLGALKRLCPTVYVHADAADRALCERFAAEITHAVEGRYPADDAGVVLYTIRRSAEENPAWYIKGQDLLLLAQMLESGRYPTARLYAVAGTGAVAPGYVASRLGAPLRHLAGDVQCQVPRYTVGGPLRGYPGDPEGHMGLYETALTVLPEPVAPDFLTLVRPGLDKPTRSRTFLSALRRKRLPMTTNVNGGRRACIACGYCADVCPVKIWPQMTFKSILAEEVEEYLAHGLLDCVECGLCSYVCPSKIELAATLQAAKHAYREEQA
jgi:Na+-transporting NADH:ubiquinone oxidoreductase subunit A